jgi:hypothetical protein
MVNMKRIEGKKKQTETRYSQNLNIHKNTGYSRISISEVNTISTWRPAM